MSHIMSHIILIFELKINNITRKKLKKLKKIHVQLYR